MAYVYSGTGQENILMSNGETRVKTFHFPNTNTPLCLLHRKQIISGKSCDIYDLCAPLQPDGTQYNCEYTEVWTTSSGTIKKNETGNVSVNWPSGSHNWGSTGISIDPTWNEYYKDYKFIRDSINISTSPKDIYYVLLRKAVSYIDFIEDGYNPDLQFPVYILSKFELNSWFKRNFETYYTEEMIVALTNKLFNSIYRNIWL